MPSWWAETHTAVTGATLTIIGGTPTLTFPPNRYLAPASASLAVTGGTPTVTIPPFAVLVTPNGATLSVTGSAPAVGRGITVTPVLAPYEFPYTFPIVFGRIVGGLSIVGGTPTVTVSNKTIVTPAAASLIITGGQPTIPGRVKPALVGTPNTSATTSVTIPAHSVGNLILIYAFARNSGTAPTIPTPGGTVPAWTAQTVGPGSGICGGRTATFVATATNHTSGTWSGAGGMIAAVISGQDATSPIGGTGSAGGSTLDCTAPAITMSDTSGVSLLAHLFGARSGGAAAVWGAPPAGYTQTAIDSTVCMDVKSVTTTDGAVTQTRTGATAGYDAHTLEILAPAPVTAPTPAPTGPAGSWTLAFNDDFNGSSLDTTKWRTNWYSGTNNVTSSTSNIAVSGGNLVLTLSDANTGAIVTTQPGGGITGFTIGADCVWEARILFPSDGTHIYNWPAFWVLNDAAGDVTCEIDIAEPWDGVMQTNYHCSGSNPSHSYAAYNDGQFHIWTLHRTPTQMLFYVDGTLVYTLAKAAADNGHPQYCILNVGRMTSNLYNMYGVASQVKVDYVRAWG